MKLPKLENPQNYTGLYIFDFGDHVAVGYTADEIAILLESEKFKDGKVYKICNAHPDGTMELRGIPSVIFNLESGMFFFCDDLQSAEKSYKQLIALAIKTSPPARAKLHLAELEGENKFTAALIYPAEYEDLFSKWLLDANFNPVALCEGGISAVRNYYSQSWLVLERHQLFNESSYEGRTPDQILASINRAVQR